MKNYVGVLCFSPDYKRLAVLTKLHGPSMLIGKLNFPGGNVEPGESDIDAAVREYREETGLVLSAEQLVTLGEVGLPGEYRLTVFYTTSADVDSVRTLTDEEVRVISLDELFITAHKEPEKLSPDLPGWVSYALGHATQSAAQQ